MELEIKHKGKTFYVTSVSPDGRYVLGTYHKDRNQKIFKVDVPEDKREELLSKVK